MSSKQNRPQKIAPKLTQQQIRHLRGLAHKRKPVIILGKAGYADSVHDELENALAHHELIKIKLNQSERASRDDLIKQILVKTNAHLVQKIGQVLSIYRASDYRASKSNVITF